MIDAPLIILPHNWEESVKRKLSWKTDILVAQAGTEQRRRLRTEPLEELTYHITLLNAEEEGELQSILWTATDGRIAVPRWEDLMLVQNPIVASDTLIAVTQDVETRQFVGDAILWIEGVGFEEIVVTAAALNAITVDPVANDWPSGTMIIPVVIGYLLSPLPGDTYGQLKGSVDITIQVESSIAEFTGGGTSVAAVPDSIQVNMENMSAGEISAGDVQAIIVDVFDAAGNIIPDANPTATTSDPAISVYPTGQPGVFNVKNNHTVNGVAVGANIDVTAGSVTVTASVSIA